MLRKFAEGLVLGAGFAIALVAVWLVASFTLLPMLFRPTMHPPIEIIPGRSEPDKMPEFNALNHFNEQDVDEQIRLASAIMLITYQRGADGRDKAIVKEFLKKNPGTTLYYDIGDEYPQLNPPAPGEPHAEALHGDGMVVFFIGSPARMAAATTFEGARVLGLGDIPLALLKEKCKPPNNHPTPQ